MRLLCDNEPAVTQNRICADARRRLAEYPEIQRKRAAPVS